MTYSRKVLFALALFCCPIVSLVKAQDVVADIQSFPSYEEVVTHYFQGHPPTLSMAEYFFEKHPDGYYMGMHDERDWEKVVQAPALLWSLAKKDFVDAGEAVENGDEVAAEYLQFRGYMAGSFDKHPYYGYAGWEDDVIGALGEMKELPDKLLNGLARAYSSKAGKMLHDRMGNKPEGDLEQYLEEFDPKVFSKSTLNAYESNVRAAIATFKQLDEQNPAYPLLVGAPRVKYANEYMTAYLDLMIIKQEKRAKAFLEQGIYPQIYLSMARNILASCPDNSILFTFGDNDTYPLFYVQETDNFRADVTIINLSLLNSPAYLNYVLTGPPKDKLPQMTLGLANYTAEALAAISDVKEGKHLVAKSFLEEIAAQMKKGKGLHTVEFAELKVRQKEGREFPAGSSPVFEFQFGAQDYGVYHLWYRSHIFLLDFLHNNAFERPVCFSTGTATSQFPGLEKLLWQQGLVFRLLPAEADLEHPRYQEAADPALPMDIDASTRLFVHAYDFEGLKAWVPQLPTIKIGLRNNLRQAFAQLILALRSAREFESAPELVGLYLKYFFQAGERFDAYNLLIAEYAYDAGLEDDARKMADYLFADANRIGTELLSGEVLEARETNHLRYIIGNLDLLFDQLGNRQRADQVRDLNRRVATLFE